MEVKSDQVTMDLSRRVCVLMLLGMLAVVTMMVGEGGVAATASKGESTPEVSIENKYSGCQPRVECAPYEDDVLFRLGEVYRFTFDVNPAQKSITCTVQCTADGAPQKLVTFVGATRGTATKYFEWTITSSGGYIRWLDANRKVIKKLTRVWTF